MIKSKWTLTPTIKVVLLFHFTPLGFKRIYISRLNEFLLPASRSCWICYQFRPIDQIEDILWISGEGEDGSISHWWSVFWMNCTLFHSHHSFLIQILNRYSTQLYSRRSCDTTVTHVFALPIWTLVLQYCHLLNATLILIMFRLNRSIINVLRRLDNMLRT